MLPLWRAVVPFVALAALGTGVERALALELGRGPERWIRRTACGLAACYAAAVHPLALVVLLALGLVLRFRGGGAAPAAPASTGSWRDRSGWLIAGALLTLAVASRPAALTYWDSFVWLAKSRVASTGWGALQAAALDPAADVTPPGYPLLWSLSASWLSMGGTTVQALAAGAAATTLLALALFLDAASDAFEVASGRPGWAAGALGVLALTPFVVVHLRSGYVDLPVGLLAATCALRLPRAAAQPTLRSTELAIAAIAAILLLGLKDEGLAHAAAVAVAAVVVSSAARRPALVMLVAAAVPFVAWRVLLSLHQVSNADHVLGAPAVEQLGALARMVVSHLIDVRTWAALWPLTLAAFLVVVLRRRDLTPATRVVALALALEVTLLLASIVFGSPRVRTFAFSGTLINRLLIQLAPTAGSLLALAVSEARG